MKRTRAISKGEILGLVSIGVLAATIIYGAVTLYQRGVPLDVVLNEIQAEIRHASAGTAQSSTFIFVIAGLAALSVILEIGILARKRGVKR